MNRVQRIRQVELYTHFYSQTLRRFKVVILPQNCGNNKLLMLVYTTKMITPFLPDAYPKFHS